MKTNKKLTAAVAEIADRTAYSALINDYMGQKKQKCQVSLLLQFVVGSTPKCRRMTGL